MNSACFIGRITQDIELKATNTGMKVVNFCIAVRRIAAKDTGAVDFIDCTAWDKKADVLSRFFHKGSMIGVSGDMRTQLVDYKGGKIKQYYLNISQISFVENKNETNNFTPVPNIYVEEEKKYNDIEVIDDNSTLPF